MEDVRVSDEQRERAAQEIREHFAAGRLTEEELSERVDALERGMGEPGFWDDQEQAAQMSAEHARATRRLGTFRQLQRDVEDLEPLAELAEEDPEIAGELEEQISAVQSRLDAL